MESNALYEARQHHMNAAGTRSADSWKHTLETAIAKCKSGLFAFLQSSTCDPSLRHKEFIETLGDGKLLAGSSWHARNIQHIPMAHDLEFDLENIHKQKNQKKGSSQNIQIG